MAVRGRGSSGFVLPIVATLVVVVSMIGVMVGDASRSGTSVDESALAMATVETVPAPEAPPFCDPALIAVWTARIGSGADEATLRLRNDSPGRCEIDVRGTAGLHRYSEPDVWLDPDATADFVIGPSGRRCLRPEEISEATFLMGGVEVRVPTAVVAICGAAFTALYPNESPDGPCVDLGAVLVPGAVVLVNRSTQSCRLGRLVEVGGDGVTLTTPSASNVHLIEVDVLGPGDSVAVEVAEVGPVGSCPVDERPVDLRFEGGSEVRMRVERCQLAVAVGPVRPWIGGLGGTSVAEVSVGVVPFPVGPGTL